MSNAARDGDDGIPVDLNHLNFLPFDKQGVDVGICTFSQYHYDLLKANQDNKFLDEKIYLGVADAKPEGFYLVGFPYEKQESSEIVLGSGETQHIIYAPMYCLPLLQIEDRQEQHPEGFWGGHGAFYGQLVPCNGKSEIALSDINNMSGGLILSIERNESAIPVYRLYGIQSAWLPESKIIRATGVEVFAKIIDELYQVIMEVINNR